MRRALFLLFCAFLGWVVLGARDIAPPPPSGGAAETDVETLIHRSQVVSSEFGAAFARAQTRVRHVNDLLGRAAHELNALSGG